MKLTVPETDDLECERSKRVFPYHVWLPYGTYSRFYEVDEINKFNTKKILPKFKSNSPKIDLILNKHLS